MDVAFGTLVIVLALIPGFVFWSGMHARASGFVEEDITSWRTPGQLARIVVTAVGIHLALFVYFSVMFWCAHRLHLLSISYVEFLFNQLQWHDDGPWWESLENAQRSVDSAQLAASYLVVTSLLGYEVGKWVSGWSVMHVPSVVPHTVWWRRALQLVALAQQRAETRLWARDFARKFVVHKFVYDLIEQIQANNFVMGYVLGKHRMNERSIVYRGWVNDLHYDRSGKLNYIVLKNMSKMECSVISSDGQGASAPVAAPRKGSDWQVIGPNDHSVGYFMGDDIENVVFDWKEPSKSAPSDADQAKAVTERVAQALSAIGPALDKAIADLDDEKDAAKPDDDPPPKA